jgi:hypothetical protein
MELKARSWTYACRLVDQCDPLCGLHEDLASESDAHCSLLKEAYQAAVGRYEDAVAGWKQFCRGRRSRHPEELEEIRQRLEKMKRAQPLLGTHLESVGSGWPTTDAAR